MLSIYHYPSLSIVQYLGRNLYTQINNGFSLFTKSSQIYGSKKAKTLFPHKFVTQYMAFNLCIAFLENLSQLFCLKIKFNDYSKTSNLYGFCTNHQKT